jgi:hypothetical protein
MVKNFHSHPFLNVVLVNHACSVLGCIYVFVYLFLLTFEWLQIGSPIHLSRVAVFQPSIPIVEFICCLFSERQGDTTLLLF